MEKQKVAEKEAETQKKIALSEAEKNAQVSLILMEQKLMEKDSTKRQEAIENEMFVARDKAQTDANFYRYYLYLSRSLLLVLILVFVWLYLSWYSICSCTRELIYVSSMCFFLRSVLLYICLLANGKLVSVALIV